MLVDNLDCLVAGGRVSRFAGALTKLINLKIIVRLNEHSLDVFTKGRSAKTFIKHCKELAEQNKDNPIQALFAVKCRDRSRIFEKIKETILPENSKATYIARLTSPIISDTYRAKRCGRDHIG